MTVLTMAPTPGKVFIYVLIDPRTRVVRYVGKARDIRVRLNSHLSQKSLATPTHKNRWIKSLLALGLKPEIQAIEIVSETDWEERERYHIARYRDLGTPLTNHAPGGRGRSNYSHSPETRKRLSEARRRRPPMSAETRAKLSAAQQVRDPSINRRNGEKQRGRKHSAEDRVRISAGAKVREETWRARGGRPISEETMNKLRERPLDHLRTPEAVAKVAASKRGKKRPPEVVARIADQLRGRKHSPEVAAKLRQNGVGHTVSSEARAIIGEKVRAAWARKRAGGK